MGRIRLSFRILGQRIIQATNTAAFPVNKIIPLKRYFWIYFCWLSIFALDLMHAWILGLQRECRMSITAEYSLLFTFTTGFATSPG